MIVKNYYETRDQLLKELVEVGKDLIENKTPARPEIEEILRLILHPLNARQLKAILEILKKTKARP